MKKKLLALLLCFAMIASIMLPMTALAVTDTWALAMSVTESEDYVYGANNALEVGFNVQSDNLTIRNAASIIVAFDANIFDLTQFSEDEETNALEKDTTDLPLTFSGAQSETIAAIGAKINRSSNWNVNIYPAQIGDTYYLLWQPNQGIKDFDVTTATDISTVYIGFKAGKSKADLTANSIRIATKEEAVALGQNKVVELTDGFRNTQNYGMANGADTLGAAPTVIWADGLLPTAPAELTGSINFSGEAVYGKTLTATFTGSHTGNLTYTWYHSDDLTTAIGTGSDYTIAKEDIGKKLTCKVTSDVETGEIALEYAAAAKKADNTAAIGASASGCTIAANNDGKLLGVNDTMEYSTDKSTWTKVPAGATEVTGLTPGTYFVRYAETDTHNPSEPVEVTVAEYEVVPDIEIAIPTAKTGLAYTSGEQVGVEEGEGYTLTGVSKATNAGTYIATATLKPGYAWTGGDKLPKAISWSIAKVDPAYTVPTGLTGTQGKALSTVSLPAGWGWANSAAVMTATGSQTFKATYTPEDITNYNVLNNIDVTVNVAAAECTHVNKTAHDAVPSTCKVQGTAAYWECNDCHKLLNDSNEVITAPASLPLDASNHANVNNVAAVASTCKTAGHGAYAKCADCGVITSGSDAPLDLDPANHEGELGGWVTTDALHWKEYSCCGAKVDQGRHNYDNDQDADCNTCNYHRAVRPVLYNVAVENDGKGTAQATPATAAAGTEITLTATPNDGYHFKEWQVISGSVSISDNKFNMPDGNVTVKAIFEADVVKTLESIEITTQPTKTIYQLYESFDAAGMVVTAHFNTGDEVVTDYTIVGGTDLQLSDTSITIQYTYGGVTKEAAVSITVEQLILHEHLWAQEWSYDNTHHWHECLAEGCSITSNSEKDGYHEHVYDDARDIYCNFCGAARQVSGGDVEVRVPEKEEPITNPGTGASGNVLVAAAVALAAVGAAYAVAKKR